MCFCIKKEKLSTEASVRSRTVEVVPEATSGQAAVECAFLIPVALLLLILLYTARHPAVQPNDHGKCCS